MSAPGRTHVVLVIEDYVDAREALVMLLHQQGFLAIGAAEGEEALRLLREGLEPCAIVLDLLMPVKDGWAFRAEQLKDPKLARIPTVVLSAAPKGSCDQLDGVVDVLPKPLDFDKLFGILARCCLGPSPARAE